MRWSFSSLIPDVVQRVQEVTELPPVPQTAQALLRLKDDPHADARRLAKLVELDPALAAQLVRYASSALFAYRGKLDSIQDAVSRVLGFDRAMHIAIGLAAGKAISHNCSGPLGIEASWRHAVYSATLMQSLASAATPRSGRPIPGLVYLAGLVHNFGHLLLGHLFEAEFRELNHAIAALPQRAVSEIETEFLGTTHCELGALLLRKWKLPAEVLTAVLQHHNPDYQGDGAVYAQLALVADRLLKRVDIGDGETHDIPAKIWDALGLREDDAVAALAALAESQGDMDELVSQLVRAA